MALDAHEEDGELSTGQTEHVQELELGILNCVAESRSVHQLVEATTRLIAGWSGCDAVGIRLKRGEDYPYLEYQGFSEEHIREEDHLCVVDSRGKPLRDSDGRVVMNCLCGDVIAGRRKPTDPCATRRGGFLCTDIPTFLQDKELQGADVCARSRCINEGYASMALIPFGIGDENIGLIHLAARTSQECGEALIAVLERTADHLAVAISRQMARDDLAEAERRYRTVADFTHDWEMWEGTDGRLEYTSPACERITGYSSDEIYDDPGLVQRIIFDADVERWRRHREEVKENPHLRDIQLRIRRKDGEVIWLEHACGPMYESDGRFLGYRSSNRDITVRKQLEEELLKREKLELVGLLAGGIAHDFNNILGGILGNISLAMMDLKENSPAYLALEDAEQATVRASDLTHRLLTFSKGGSPIKQQAQVQELIRNSAEFVLSGSRCRCEYVFAPSLGLISVDTNQFSQVIQSIVRNSEQAMPEGGVIRITVENEDVAEANPYQLKPGLYVKMVIQDGGKGIPSDLVDKVLDPFVSTRPRATGLGLTSAQSIVVKHDGHLGIASELGRGTTVTIRFPAALQRESDDRVGADAPQAKPTPINLKTKVLVMDDDPGLRQIVTRVLERVGCEVITAVNSVQAVKLFESALETGEPFELAILDLTVPGGPGGLETIKMLRQLKADVRGIVCSGYSNDPVLSKYRDAGFDAALSKPFRPDELTGLIARVMGK